MESIVEICKELPVRKSSNTQNNFGVEIECGLLDAFDKGKLVDVPKMHLGTDITIKKGISTEITSDVLTPSLEDFKILKDLSEILNTIPMYLQDCSFQTSIDSDLSVDELFNLLLLVSVYEKVLYRFSLGKDKQLRNGVKEYAGSMRLYLKEVLKRGYTKEDIINNLIGIKNWAIALKCQRNDHLKFTGSVTHIEFRTPNGCIDYELWMNYISAFENMIKSSRRVDVDKLLYDFDRMNYNMSYDSVSYVNLEKAKELADIIFDCDLDKLYFYKQYLGLYDYDKELVKDKISTKLY